MITVKNEGSVLLFVLGTAEDKTWVEENLPLEEWQWLGPMSFAVDTKLASVLVLQMRSEGLEVEPEREVSPSN
jgi:hypothetical protein